MPEHSTIAIQLTGDNTMSGSKKGTGPKKRKVVVKKPKPAPKKNK